MAMMIFVEVISFEDCFVVYRIGSMLEDQYIYKVYV